MLKTFTRWKLFVRRELNYIENLQNITDHN